MEFEAPRRDHHTVTTMKWGLLSPDEVKRRAVCEITTDSVGGRVTFNDIADNTLCDRRMGPFDPQEQCATCDRNGYDCPGHTGYIALARPMLVDHFVKVARRAITSVCPNPSCLATYPQPVKSVARDKASVTRHAAGYVDAAPARTPSRPARCVACERFLPKIRLAEDKCNFILTWPDRSVPEKYTGTKILKLIRSKPDSLWRSLGYDVEKAHPAWYLLENLTVMPTCLRPYTKSSFGYRPHAFTSLYAKIVLFNNVLKRGMEDGYAEHVLEMNEANLHEAVRLLFDSTKRTKRKGGGRGSANKQQIFPGIRQDIKGKEGALRRDSMGVRANQTARTVITADPELTLEEVGIPHLIANKLSIPEVVTAYNMREMVKLVRERRARLVSKQDGSSFTTLFLPDETLRALADSIEVGNVVHRPLRDGDPVIANRQPSLHKGSMMCHIVRVMWGLTARINMSTCPSYNADFDGDEINLHVPQTLAARVEALSLMRVKDNIVSTKGPVMSLIYDALLGAYEMTSPATFLTRDETLDVLMRMGEIDRIPHPTILAKDRDGRVVPYWTGKSVLSRVFHPDFTYGRWTETMCATTEDGTTILAGGFEVPKRDRTEDDLRPWDLMYGVREHDSLVRIRRGEILTGRLSKATVGSGQNGIVHRLFIDFSPETCADFLTRVQFTLNKWLSYCGYSTSAMDGYVPDRRENAAKAREMIESDSFKRASESNKVVVLNAIRDKAGTLVRGNETFDWGRASRKFQSDNHFLTTIAAGSKGNPTNFVQTAYGLGQQYLNMERIPLQLNDGERCLPHFECGDMGAIQRGLVLNSFFSGLTGPEYYFHAVGGREGVVDTAVKTSVSGYLGRQMIKVTEDVTVVWDGTLRKTNGNLIQFNYGDDGFNGTAFRDTSRDDVFTHVPLYDTGEGRMFSGAEHRRWCEARAFLDSYFATRKKFRMPFSFDAVELDSEKFNEGRILLEKRSADGPGVYSDAKYDAFRAMDYAADAKWCHSQILQAIRELWELEPLGSEAHVAWKEKRGDEGTDFRIGNVLINALILYNYTSQIVVERKRWSRMRLLAFLEELVNVYRKAKVTPGDGLGVIAAQSISEPATQMTLNTFHQAGLGLAATSGMPRLYELIHATRNDTTPMMTFAVVPGEDYERTVARAVCVQLKNCLDGDTETRIEFDSDANNETREGWEVRYLASGLFDVTKLFAREESVEPRPKRVRKEANHPDGDGEELEDGEERITTETAIVNAAARLRERPPPPNERERDDSIVNRAKRRFSIRLALNERVLRRYRLNLHAIKMVIENNFKEVQVTHSHERMNPTTKERERFEEPRLKVYAMGTYAETRKLASKLKEMTLSGLHDTTFEVDTAERDKSRFTVMCKTREAAARRVERRRKGGGGQAAKKKTEGEEEAAAEGAAADEDDSDLLEPFEPNVLQQSWVLESIDHTKTYSTCVSLVYETLGIEAAKAVLEREMASVFNATGTHIVARHPQLLSEVMCFDGNVQSIRRTGGIHAANESPLGKATFEEPIKAFIEGAVNAKVDPMNDVSACITTGTKIPIGTGSSFQLLPDTDAFAKIEFGRSLNDRVSSDGAVTVGKEWKNDVPIYKPVVSTAPTVSDVRERSRTGKRKKRPVPNPFGFDFLEGEEEDVDDEYESGEETEDDRYTTDSFSSSFVTFSSFGAGGTQISTPRDVGESPLVHSTRDDTPASPRYTSSSPTEHSPASPKYSPASPKYSPASPKYSPASPKYSPASPKYSPSSPSYSPTAHERSPTGEEVGFGSLDASCVAVSHRKRPAPSYSPSSPTYSPTGSPTGSPKYVPSTPNDYDDAILVRNPPKRARGNAMNDDTRTTIEGLF